MTPLFCSRYEVETWAELHDLVSGTLAVGALALIGLAMLIGEWSYVASVAGRRVASAFLVVALAVGAGASWLGGELVTSEATCRTFEWGGRSSTTHVKRSGFPAYYASVATEGDTTPTVETRDVVIITNAAGMAGVALGAIVAVWRRRRGSSGSPASQFRKDPGSPLRGGGTA